MESPDDGEKQFILGGLVLIIIPAAMSAWKLGLRSNASSPEKFIPGLGGLIIIPPAISNILPDDLNTFIPHFKSESHVTFTDMALLPWSVVVVASSGGRLPWSVVVVASSRGRAGQR
nr:hypothetical protein Iba_chr12bCG27220 [Ipomoea batatas]